MVQLTPLLMLALVPLTPSAAAPGGVIGPDRAAPADTTVAVSEGDRLVLQNLTGRVSVETWGRDEVRVVSNGHDEVGVRVDRRSGAVHVRPDPRYEGDRERYVVTVPAWMSIDVRGHELDASIRGVNGGVSVRTADGRVEVSDARGPVSARSVEGTVTVEDVDGPVTAASGDDDVSVRRVRGPVVAQTIDGDVVLEDVSGAAVEGSTVDGSIYFSGALEARGEYRLVTHDGDVTVALSSPVSASVVVSTFDGDFESDFAVTMERFTAGKELRFTLGDGGARLFLEAFDGNIRLRRR